MTVWNGEVSTKEELRSQKKRVALRVASRIFNEKGYHGTSLDDVAEKIGVTKAALYYYFKNKEQLLFECMSLSYNCVMRAIAESKAMKGSSFDRLKHHYLRSAELLMTERGAYTSNENLHALPEVWRNELMEQRRQIDRYARELIQGCVDEGSVRPVDVRLTSNYYAGAISWILRWYTDDEEASPAEIADAFIDLTINGIVSDAKRAES